MSASRIDETRAFVPLGIAVLTVSDTRTPADDKSGDTLAQRLSDAGHRLAARGIVPDDIEAIRNAVRGFIADPAVDIVITTGGTGFTGRDVTPEALEPLFDKRMDGFSTLFHQISAAKIGTSTLQSRSQPPGLPARPSSSACRQPRRLPRRLGRHSRRAARLPAQACNFVEIMPRLDEHLRRPKAQGATV